MHTIYLIFVVDLLLFVSFIPFCDLFDDCSLCFLFPLVLSGLFHLDFHWNVSQSTCVCVSWCIWCVCTSCVHGFVYYPRLCQFLFLFCLQLSGWKVERESVVEVRLGLFSIIMCVTSIISWVLSLKFPSPILACWCTTDELFSGLFSCQCPLFPLSYPMSPSL